MVKTRTTQVFNQIENDILKAVEDDNSFNFATLANSIDLQYQELLKDGLITENDLTLLREDVPKLIEIQQVRKLSRSNAAEAVAALLNPKIILKYLKMKEQNLLVNLVHYLNCKLI